MTLEDFFASLSYSELSNLSAGEEGSGGIELSSQGKVAQATNQALTSLYSRYEHNLDYAHIQLIPGLEKYTLSSKHAISNVDPLNLSPRYIVDSALDPFMGDVVKIIGVSTLYDPYGYQNYNPMFVDQNSVRRPRDLLLNDRKDPRSLKTLSYNTLYVPYPRAEQTLTVEIQLNHPKISIPVDLNQEIELHPVLYEALGFKVAAKVYGSMNGEENMAKSVHMENLYESSCALVDQKDLLQESHSSEHRKLNIRGWI